MTVKEQVANEAARIQEDALYSAKSHFNTSECWEKVRLWLGLGGVVISAVAGASALSTFDCHGTVAGILALSMAALTAVVTFINPSERASTHQEVGNKYNALKNDARIFYNIQLSGLDEQAATDGLKELNERRNKLNMESPKVPQWAFNAARKGIKDGQADYKVDRQENLSEH